MFWKCKLYYDIPRWSILCNLKATTIILRLTKNFIATHNVTNDVILKKCNTLSGGRFNANFSYENNMYLDSAFWLALYKAMLKECLLLDSFYDINRTTYAQCTFHFSSHHQVNLTFLPLFLYDRKGTPIASNAKDKMLLFLRYEDCNHRICLKVEWH